MSFHPDDERARLRDDEAERRMHAELRADARAEKGPPPELPDETSREFLAAADRGCAIYGAGDNARALARAVGVRHAHLLKMADEFCNGAVGEYARLPSAAIPMAVTADALLLGMLIGRELPRP